jgi:hypothetical protein
MTAPIAGAIGIGGSILSGIFGAQGATELGSAQNQMYQYQASMAQWNSRIALQNADYERQYGEEQALKYGIGAAFRQGEISSTLAGRGLDVGSGSAAAVQSGQRQITALDTAQIRSNAAKVAYNYDVQSQTDLQQAQLYQLSGQDAILAANVNATSSILGSVSSVSSKWLQASQVGLPSSNFSS